MNKKEFEKFIVNHNKQGENNPKLYYLNSDIPAHKLGTYIDTERQIVSDRLHKEYGEKIKLLKLQYGKEQRVDENEGAREVIEFCKGALEDAIYCEDGLDGLAGERVIKMIVDWQSRIKELKDE